VEGLTMEDHTLNETTATAIGGGQTVYWPDGYWITSREDAELLDEFDAFGGQSTALTVPAGTDIQTAVNDRISQGGPDHAAH